jgi:hypothetical protein
LHLNSAMDPIDLAAIVALSSSCNIVGLHLI